jgi:hypothetical protein
VFNFSIFFFFQNDTISRLSFDEFYLVPTQDMRLEEYFLAQIFDNLKLSDLLPLMREYKALRRRIVQEIKMISTTPTQFDIATPKRNVT